MPHQYCIATDRIFRNLGFQSRTGGAFRTLPRPGEICLQKDELISEDFLDQYLIRTLPRMEVGITTRQSSHLITERNFTDSRFFFMEATVRDLQR